MTQHRVAASSSFAVFALCALLLNGCGLVGDLKDLTFRADGTLQNINAIIQLVDQRVQNGELSEEAGEFIDERLAALADEINGLVDESGGKLFDRLDGSVDNAFDGIEDTLEQIRTALLDRNEGLVRQLTVSIQDSTLILAGQAEGLLVLTFGNVQLVVDKVANSIITLVVVLLLAVGLLIFVFAFRKSGWRNPIGLGFAALYTLVLLAVLFVPQARAVLVYGVGAGQEFDPQELPPKITAVSPSLFVMGESDRLTIYGQRLDRIPQDSEIALFQGGERIFSFPRAAVAAITPMRIVLGNFEEKLGWVPPDYEDFYGQVVPGSGDPSSHLERYTLFAAAAEAARYPALRPGLDLRASVRNQLPVQLELMRAPSPSSAPAPGQPGVAGAAAGRAGIALAGRRAVLAIDRSRVEAIESSSSFQNRIREFDRSVLTASRSASIRQRIERETPAFASIRATERVASLRRLASLILPSSLSSLLSSSDEVFFDQFGVRRGDYQLSVLRPNEEGEAGGEAEVPAAQVVSLDYPTPPMPLPDLRPTRVVWHEADHGVRGEKHRLRLTIALSNPEGLRGQEFVVRTRSELGTIPDVRVDFRRSDERNRMLELTTAEFEPRMTGRKPVTVTVDPAGQVEEHNEANNTLSSALRVREFVYDAKVEFLSFESLRDKDGTGSDEYRLEVSVDPPRGAPKRHRISQSGNPGTSFPIAKTIEFRGLRDRDEIVVRSTLEESDGGLRDGDDFMGTTSATETIEAGDFNENLTQTVIPFDLGAGSVEYKIRYRVTFTRRTV